MKKEHLDTRWGGLLAIGILGMMASLSALSFDMYLPGFQSIAKDFGTTSSAIQITLSASFLGVAIGMPIWGPFSDRLGRKWPALVSITLYLVGTILCANANNLQILTVDRFIQALGGSGVMVIGRAIVRDIYVGERMARTLGAVSSVLLTSSIISPSLGAFILHISDWRWVFLVLFALGVIALVGTAIFPESLLRERRSRNGIGATLVQYGVILKDRTFRFAVGQQAFNTLTLMSYVSCAPSVMMGHFGMSEQAFGVLFGVNAMAMLTATQIHRRLLKTKKITYLLPRLLVFQFAAAMGLVVFGVLTQQLWVVVAFIMLTTSILPSITAGATTIAMTNFADSAAQASSVIGLVQSIAGAVGTAVLVAIPVDPLTRMLIGIGAAAVAALAMLIARTKWAPVVA